MLIRGRERPTYRFNSNPQTRLWHCCIGHASNTKVVQASKLVDEIDLEKATSPDNELHSFDSEFDNEDSNTDTDNKPTTINKVSENDLKYIEQLCKTFIKSKYTRIIKSKKMTLITRRLQEVHADLWGSYKPASILRKNYVALLLNISIRKSWILFLRNKNEFFDMFKLWLPRIESSRSKLNCLQMDGRGEFTSVALQSFCHERGIKTGYVTPYIHEENGIVKWC